MNNKNHDSLHEVEILKQLPVWFFSISFITGTILLLLHLIIPKNFGYIEFGIVYTFIAFAINSLLLIGLIITSFYYKKHQKTILIRGTLLLLNIPIALIYLFIVMSNILNHSEF
ncbi:MAG: hypothetical protein BM557_05655 [Flavobacterium sp. MedPE-SWcel]|nr:MAG: hypothetical protein BM557_05655 [Flavobacterium sp. MedPE-SWcel]